MSMISGMKLANIAYDDATDISANQSDNTRKAITVRATAQVTTLSHP